MSKYIVTITPPTPNGDIHIGHLAGPFLGADVFTRAQRQRGHDCILVSYSDDYQSYMLRKGLELGMDHRDVASANTIQINRSLKAVDIDVDKWLTSQDNLHFRDAVADAFWAARTADVLEWKTAKEPYCPDCDVWGYEAFGRGLCNFCGQDSDASQCEECAQAPDASKMTDFVCKLCGKDHEWRPVERWFLKLGAFKDYLRKLHTENPMRPPLGQWAAEAIGTLEDWGVTRPGDAGLDLEEDGSCRIHTWFMGLSGYIAAVREYAAEIGQPELADSFFDDPSARFYHFLGYDCAFSHTLVYPALLSNMNDYAIQQRFVPNMFLKLDGLNLSTSREHAIWVAEFAERAPSDSIRLYLASMAPEQDGDDFWTTEFETWKTDVFENLIPELLERGRGLSAGTAGTCHPDTLARLQDLSERLERAAAPDTFSMKMMAQVVLDTLDMARDHMHSGGDLIEIVRFLAAASQPLVPRLSNQLVDEFGLDPVDLARTIEAPAIA